MRNQEIKQLFAYHRSGERKYKFYFIEDEILLIIDLLNPGAESPLLLRSVMYESWKKISFWENAGWTLGRF